MSRRALLAGLGIGVAAAGAYATPALQLSWTRKPGAKAKDSWWDRQFTSLERAGADEWSRQIGARFALAGGAMATLVAVQPLRSPGRRPAGLRDGAFAIVLEAAGGSLLPAADRVLDVVHPDAGAMKIYFSACGGTCGADRLQAIFN